MRTALFASLLVLVFGSSPVMFRGCGDDPPPDIVLPPSPPDGGICATDADCIGTSACADVRCLAGTCVLVSSDVDRDHDGNAAPPCGTDCDDGDRFVHPGAEELCNGHDDDCNGIVDDGAEPTVTNRVVAGLDGYASVAALGDTFIVAVGNDARTLDRYGRVGPVFDVLGDRVVTRTETATAPDGRVIVASILEGGALSYAVITPGTPPTVAPAVDVPIWGTVMAVSVVAHAGSFALAWSTYDGLTTTSLLVKPDIQSAEEPFQVGADLGYASLASDGTAVAFPEGTGWLGFLAPGGFHATPALGGMLLQHALASGDGTVVALTIDPAGGTAARATRFASSAAGGLVSIPVLDTFEGFTPSDETRLALADGRYVATRAGFGDLHLVTFDTGLARTTLDVTLPRSGQIPVSIAGLPGIIAILGATPSSALSAGTDLVLIAACTAP